MTEIASQSAPAATTDSAPVIKEETKVTPEVTESASVTEEKIESTETVPEKTEEMEPESKAVKELKAQRLKRQKAEQEAAYWRGVAEGTKGGVKPTEVPEQKPLVIPKMEDFPDDYEAFRTAERKYYIEEAKRELKAEFDQKDQATTQQTHEARVKADFETMIETEAETNPDFPEIVKEMGDRITPAMGRTIMESKMAAELIMHFHNNPKLEKEISKLSVQSLFAAATRIGEIVHELKTKPKPEPIKKITTAPAPVKTVEATAPNALVDVDDLPIGDYIRVKNEQQFARRKR